MATVVTGYVPKPEGDAALQTGIEEARRRGATLITVHAQADPGPEPDYVADVRAEGLLGGPPRRRRARLGPSRGGGGRPA